MDDVIYASRIVGLPVLDPDGLAIGHVDDVIIGAQADDRSPPVIGFVVAVPGRRIFLNAGRVASLTSEGLRLGTADINLRRFAARPTERLVVHDLLDGPAPRVDGVINDVGLRRSPNRRYGWEVVHVIIVDARRRLLRGRRSGEHHTLAWREVADMFGRGPGDRFAHLREMHPVDVAHELQDMEQNERVEAAKNLDDEQLADLLEELPEEVQAELIDEIDVERAADVLEAMAPDDAADLLSELETGRRSELLEAMEPDEAEPVRRLLRYEAASAGGLMNPEPILLSPSATVAEALARLRDPDVPPAMAGQAFVVEPPLETPTGRFLGTCHFQQLLRERPGTPVGEVLRPDDPEPVAPTLGDVEVAERLAAYNLLAVPVCDRYGRLLGVVTVDDVLDRVLPQGWRIER